MILFPAIDLKDGECVRLELGDMDQATVFNEDPAGQARKFAEQGFEWLHLVDLNGAFEGRPVNAEAVDAILKAVDLPVQLGGGIRNLDMIERWLAKGIRRVILGTIAVRDPGLVKRACKAFPGCIAVGIDARGGRVAIEGWAETSSLQAGELAARFEDAGVAAIIYTDIDRDGVLKGINIEATLDLASSTSIPIIASGGLASIEDISRLLQPDCARLEGVISGRALYDGRLDAVAAPRSHTPLQKRCVMLKARVIPCLDVKDGRVVKGVNFVDLRDAGDPVEIAKAYDAAGADELCFLDITASHEDRGIILDVVRHTAEQCFMPLTVGGGVRTVDDIRRLLLAGADKVSINTAAVNDRQFVRQAAEKFGSQCIVVAIDAKRASPPDESPRWEIFTHGGREAAGIDAVEFAREVVALGAGEILLTSMDRDGTGDGFDVALTRAVSDAVSVPVIASGGVGNLDHMAEGIIAGGATAVLAASIFHFGTYSIGQAKDHMAACGVPVRRDTDLKEEESHGQRQ